MLMKTLKSNEGKHKIISYTINTNDQIVNIAQECMK